MSLRIEIMSLAQELEHENDAASDLWSYLPSHKAAIACHGNYVSNLRPDPAVVMIEATNFLAFLGGFDKSEEQRNGWFECPCNECLGPKTCRDCDMYIDSLMRCKAVEGVPHCDEGKPHEKCPFIRGNGGLIQKSGGS